jgi:hypothetical protein
VCARRSGPRARRKPISEKHKQSAPFVPGCSAGARFCVSSDGACERIASSSNETRRRAFESRFSVGKKKKRHLFFDENAVGAD